MLETVSSVPFEMPIEFPFEFVVEKTFEEKKDVQDTENLGTWIVEGFASTTDLDSQEHRISEQALKEGAESLKEYNTLLYNHDVNKPIGKILLAEARDGYLFIKSFISHSEPTIWKKVQDGTLSKFSIKGQILDAETKKDEGTGEEYTLIKSMRLFEVSIVSVPANAKARSLSWYIEKALKGAKANGSCNECEEEGGSELIVELEQGGPSDRLRECIANKAARMVMEGMERAAAITKAEKDCKAEQETRIQEAEKTGTDFEKPFHGGSMADCVQRRSAQLRRSMDPQAARRQAIADCKRLQGDTDEELGDLSKQERFTSKPWDGSRVRFSLEQLLRSVPAAIRAHAKKTRGKDLTKTDSLLALPYREPNGTINVNAVRAGLAVLGGARGAKLPGIPAEAKERARTELQNVLNRFNKANEADEETLDRLCAENPWLIDLIDEVENILENEGGVQEEMAENEKLKKAGDALKDAVMKLEGIMPDLDGEARQQVASVVSSLKALMERVAEPQKSEGDGEGEAAKGEEGKEHEANAEEEGKKLEASAEEEGKEEGIELSELAQVLKTFEEKMDQAIATMRELSAKVEKQAEETKQASVTASAAREEIEKTASTIKEAAELLPLRKGQGPESDNKDDRNSEVKKSTAKDKVIERVGDEKFKNAKPGQRLQWLIEAQGA